MANFSDLEKKIRELNEKIDRLGGKSFKNIDDVLASIRGNTREANALFEQMTTQVEFLENAFDNISTSLRNALNDLKGQSDLIQQVNKSYGKLESITRQINYHQKNEQVLSIQKLKTLQKEADEEVKILTAKRDALKVEAEAGRLRGKKKQYYDEINAALNKEEGILNEINGLIENEVKLEKKRNNNLGLTGGIFKGIHQTMKNIGVESEAFDRINASMREAATHGNGLSVVSAGLKSTFNELRASLDDSAVRIGIIAGTFGAATKIAFDYSETIFEAQKALGTNHEEARKLTNNLYDSWETTQGLYSTFQDLSKSQIALNSTAGTFNAYGVGALDNFTKLTEVAGLTNEEAAKLQEYGDLYNESSEDIYNNIGKTKKGLLSNKNIMSQVLKIEGQLAAQYGNDEKRLAKAVVQANKMGMSLEQAQKAARGLLDFEQSIEDEISAELLTGKSLNLERARALALQGDSAGAAEEMLKQVGGIDKFNKMNVIQQEAIAKSMGLSTDELANSLVKQKQYENLGKSKSDRLRKEIQALKDAGKIEEANLLEKKGLEGENVELSKQQISDAMKVQKAMDNAKAAFMKAIAPVLESVSNILTTIMQVISQNPWLKTALKIVGAGVAIGAGVAALVSIGKTIGSIFGGGGGGILGMFTKKGSTPANPMYTYNVNESGGMLNSTGPSGKWGGMGMNIFKGLSKVFGGKSTMVGRGLRSTAAFLGKPGGIFGKIYHGTRGTLGSPGSGGLKHLFNPTAARGIPGLTAAAETAQTTSTAAKSASTLSKLTSGLSKAAKVLGPVGAILDLGMGTYQGSQAGNMTKEQQKAAGIRQGMGSVEGGVAGFLTGGAEKGSMLSEYVGIEKGSGADEAMGVLGAAGRGALIGSVFGPIGAAVGAGVGGIAESVKLLFNPDSELRKNIDSFGESLKEGFSSAWEFNKEAAGLAWDTMKGWGSSVADWASEAGDSISTFTSNSLEGLSSLASEAGDFLSDAVEGAGKFFSDTAEGVGDFFGFADGGIVTGPTRALIGEAGQNEAVIPLNQFYAKIDQLINAVNNIQNGGGGGTSVVKLDGQKVGEVLRLATRQVQ